MNVTRRRGFIRISRPFRPHDAGGESNPVRWAGLRNDGPSGPGNKGATLN
jgi:hypothetical protein